MKKIISLALATIITITALAQEDKKAKEILDQVSAKTKAYKTITAEFTNTLDNQRDKVKETNKGTISIKGNKYKLNYLGADIYSDGKTVWTYQKDANEVTITEPDLADDQTLNPAKIFTIYEKGYKYKFIQERFEKARALYEIELYPIDRKKNFSKIKLQIDKTKMQLFSVKYYGSDGNNYTIEILKINPNTEISEAIFLFEKAKYPKVEVIDMR